MHAPPPSRHVPGCCVHHIAWACTILLLRPALIRSPPPLPLSLILCRPVCGLTRSLSHLVHARMSGVNHKRLQ
eukprot:362982-Chlamydomonas_euryale.AAC.3